MVDLSSLCDIDISILGINYPTFIIYLQRIVVMIYLRLYM